MGVTPRNRRRGAAGCWEAPPFVGTREASPGPLPKAVLVEIFPELFSPFLPRPIPSRNDLDGAETSRGGGAWSCSASGWRRVTLGAPASGPGVRPACSPCRRPRTVSSSDSSAEGRPSATEDLARPFGHLAQVIDHFGQVIDHFARLIRHFAEVIHHSARLTGHFRQVTGHFDRLIDHFAPLTDHLPEVTGHFAGLTDDSAEVSDHSAPLTGHLAEVSRCLPPPFDGFCQVIAGSSALLDGWPGVSAGFAQAFAGWARLRGAFFRSDAGCRQQSRRRPPCRGATRRRSIPRSLGSSFPSRFPGSRQARLAPAPGGRPGAVFLL